MTEFAELRAILLKNTPKDYPPFVLPAWEDRIKEPPTRSKLSLEET